MKDDMVFGKGKDGHYRYMSKNELKKKIRGIKLATVCFYIILFFVLIGVGYYVYVDINDFYLRDYKMTVNVGSYNKIDLIPKNSIFFKYSNNYYVVDNPSIAEIDSEGVITAKSVGTTNIYIRFKNGLERKVLTLSVIERPDYELNSNEENSNEDYFENEEEYNY